MKVDWRIILFLHNILFLGNVENFIHDIENCFRTFKTITNTQNVVLWNYVKELILESFDDAIVSILYLL